MKFILVFLLLGGCAWKQRDFEKELNTAIEVAEPSVNVDKKLLEKFEVEDTVVEEPEKPVEDPAQEAKPIVTKKQPVKTPTKKTISKSPTKVIKKEEPKKPSVVPAKVPKLPADYPPELVALDKKAKKVWDLYKPNHSVGDKVYLNIYYLGMTVGKIMFTNNGKKMMGGKEVWNFHARFKSAPFYSNIYELDDTVNTFVTTDKFLSTRYSLIQRESKQDIDDLQLHDRDQLKTFWFYKRKTEDKEKTKEKEAYIPFYSTDPFSVLFLYQGLPLKDGDLYEIPLINKGKVLILKSVVEGREVVRTANGDRAAIRVHATTKYSGDHLKSGDLYFWFSDDEKRTMIKAQAKIKIGSVTAEIVDG